MRCRSEFRSTLVELTCHCGKIFHRAKKMSIGNVFCSKSCAAKHNNKNKITGFRRSKLEKWLENQLKYMHSDLDFQFNSRSLSGLELDIYIPSINLAFELNGITHFKPIYGNEKFNKIKNNDLRKIELCKNRGITLYVIDTSLQHKFSEDSSKAYLDNILSAISQMLSVSKKTA